MEELTQVTTYQQYKHAMDTELRRSTESFVRIGYLLKVARDTDILHGSGYNNVNEFAQAEYNIDKTQVSRFIHINDRFSEGGYSDRLMEQYQNFGHAKLTIMLQLPDELNEVLTPEYSKAEIQMLKEEVDEEKKITDLEIMMEGQNAEQAVMDNNMSRVLHQMFRENPEKFVEIHRALQYGLDEVMLTLAPSGTAIYNVRLQGIGRIAFSIHEDDAEAQLVNIRSGELEKYPWTDVMRMLESMINALCDAESEWERIYGEPFPKKEEVAPVQPTTVKAEKPRKESKVVKSKPVEKKPEPQVAAEPEEPLPGQMDITEFKDVLPESAESPENVINAECDTDSEPEIIKEEDIEVVEEPETPINAMCERSPEEIKKIIAGYKAGITSSVRNIPRLMQEKKWKEIGDTVMEIKWRADKIMELEEK